MNAPVSHHERARLAALYRYRILDLHPERDFDVVIPVIA